MANENPYRSPGRSGAPATPIRVDEPGRHLSLIDSVAIIVGVIVGSGIYESTPLIASSAGSFTWLIAVWIIGGLMALVGALCYAELATAYPRDGGEYVYLTRAYGRPLGFSFAWAELWIIGPGSIGAMAYVFANYADQLLPNTLGLIAWAGLCVAVLTIVNCLGIRTGKWTQNLLTLLKVAGLLAIFIVAFWGPRPAADSKVVPPEVHNLELALILVMFTYGGWNQIAAVAAEVRQPQRNMLRALVTGVLTVTCIYVLFNLAVVYLLGFDQVASSEAVAADSMRVRFPDGAARAISLLVCVSSLGAINGQILTGARVMYAMGREHRRFGWLGRWNSRFQSPIASLVAQGLVTLALIVGFGWGEARAGFGRMVIFTTPVFWLFFLLVGISVFVLRHRDAQTPRPVKAWGYPLTPLLLCAAGAYMLYASFDYAIENRSFEALWSVALLAIGVAIGWRGRSERRRG